MVMRAAANSADLEEMEQFPCMGDLLDGIWGEMTCFAATASSEEFGGIKTI
jgi:hypothetical protein